MFSYENLPTDPSVDANSGDIYGTITNNLLGPDDNLRDDIVRLTLSDRIRVTDPMNDTESIGHADRIM